MPGGATRAARAGHPPGPSRAAGRLRDGRRVELHEVGGIVRAEIQQLQRMGRPVGRRVAEVAPGRRAGRDVAGEGRVVHHVEDRHLPKAEVVRRVVRVEELRRPTRVGKGRKPELHHVDPDVERLSLEPQVGETQLRTGHHVVAHVERVQVDVDMEESHLHLPEEGRRRGVGVGRAREIQVGDEENLVALHRAVRERVLLRLDVRDEARRRREDRQRGVRAEVRRGRQEVVLHALVGGLVFAGIGVPLRRAEFRHGHQRRRIHEVRGDEGLQRRRHQVERVHDVERQLRDRQQWA